MISSIPSSVDEIMRNSDKPPLLEIQNLVVEYPTLDGNVRAVDNVSLTIDKGEVLGLVGESGCGKSTLGYSILGLLQGGVIRSGRILYNKKDLVQLSEEEMEKLRGSDISMVFQASQNALNPLQKVSDHFIDTLKVHELWTEEKWEEVKSLLHRLEIPPTRLKDNPFQFSGGMQQRIVIALTLILNPKMIIADEPTTALDVLVQARLLQLLKDIIREYKLTVIYITHDLGVVAEITNRVAIMYAGQIVEVGDTFTIFESPAHPYTQALIKAIPNVKEKEKKQLSFIPGHPPDLRNPPKGCSFADRCTFVKDVCRKESPELIMIGSKSQHIAKCLMFHESYESHFR
ncbi:MAG: ABC transporter ATP-binding protein [Candidatus Thorarchaeota archaeon]